MFGEQVTINEITNRFNGPTGFWVMLCFYTSYTLPKLFDLFFIRRYVCVARLCLEASVKLSLIIHKHSILSVLLVPFCEPFDLLCCSLKILLQSLYYCTKAFTSNLEFFFFSFFLLSSSQGLFLHSAILLTSLLSLSTLINSRSFHSGC